MNKVNPLLIFIFLIFSSYVKSQQDAQYTNYMYNTQLIQPAYVGTSGYTKMTLLGRIQWIDLNGGPETLTLSIDTPVGKNENMGLGLSLFSDKIGPSSENRITIDYGYSINFPFSKLTFGLKGGISELDVDYSQLNIADENDPYVLYNNNKLKPEVGLGIYFNTENYYLGISAPNILETKYYDEFEIENSSFSKVANRIHYYGMAGFVFDLTKNIKVKPASLIKVVEGSPIQWDLSINFLFNRKTTIGIANRLDSAFCLLGGFQLSQKFFLGLSYDYMTNEIRSVNSGSYEIVFRFNLFSNDGKILTPRFF